MISNDATSKQHLAAILAADAVGYSRLMEADEEGTMAALDRARDVFRTQAALHHGRVINTAGDSVLAVFDTAAGAVASAVEVQRLLGAQGDAADSDVVLRFRIGLHLGDIMERPDGDIAGDGVNVAARLQALAPPGGIVVSDAIRGAVKARVVEGFDDLGLHSVKNISDPVRAFAVRQAMRPTPVAVRAMPAIHGMRSPLSRYVAIASALILAALAGWWWVTVGVPRSAQPPAGPVASTQSGGVANTRRASIAVLPFDNMSGEADKAYFADGMTEDLITDLSKVGALTVIARNSTFQYKGKARDVREIGKALNAQYVLEGSVRRSGDNVRVNAQLIDAASGAHVWADRYDGELKNIFALQDTIARNVVKALAVQFTTDESERVAHRGTGNVAAYDLMLQGWQHYLRQTPDEFKLAIADFNKATELDPSYGRAWAALAAIHWEAYTRYWGPQIGLERHTQYAAEQYLAKALKDPTPLAYEVSSAMLLHNQQHQDALDAAQRAVAMDPNDADGYIALASALSFSGRPAEAVDAVEHGMRLNPHYPSSYAYQRGLALFCLNRLDEAAASLVRALELNRDDYWSQRLLVSIYGTQRKQQEAKHIIDDIRSNEGRGRYAAYDPLTIRAVTYWYPFARPEDARRFATGLARAGVPD